MTTEMLQYKNCTVLKNNNDYEILWSRGKEVLNYPISQELAERVSKSEQDSLEVMFYCEHHRWPKADELNDYNHSDTIVHKGDGFVVYETNGYYEISFFKEIGGAMGPEVRYPISKELMDKAFASSRGAYEVMIYAETGRWPLSKQDDIDRNYIRNHPETMLSNIEDQRELFDVEEFKALVKKAISSELKPTELDAIGTVDNHLEVLLVDSVGWQEEIETVHLEILQEKINNYIYFLESKQYVERYGDNFDKKVIHITFQYSPSDNGLAFLATVQKTLQNTDMSLKVEFPDDETLPEKKSSLADVSHPKQEQEKVSQERYLQIKKEYKIRLVLVIFLLVLSFILYLLIVLSFSRHIPFIATVMGTVIPFNHFLLVPVWQEKKAIEEEHPEWKNLSTSGVKVPSSESDKKILPFIGTVLALFFSFAMLYRPVKVNKPIPSVEEINKIPKLDRKTPKTSSSSSSERANSSDSGASSSTEESTKAESSGTESSKDETHNYDFHLPGVDDEELRRVIDRSKKDFRENHAKEQTTE